eukprot:2125310-Rhodomonas_salina.1
MSEVRCVCVGSAAWSGESVLWGAGGACAGGARLLSGGLPLLLTCVTCPLTCSLTCSLTCREGPLASSALPPASLSPPDTHTCTHTSPTKKTPSTETRTHAAKRLTVT